MKLLRGPGVLRGEGAPLAAAYNTMEEESAVTRNKRGGDLKLLVEVR